MRNKIRYSEVFFSLQSEGKYVGVPSIFLRMFGCNFRCRGFGRPNIPNDEKINPEVQEIIGNISQYQKFEDLPLVHTGCDTYASIYPQFKKFMKDETIEEVTTKLNSMVPNNSWEYSTGQDIHFILTGGEPLLGWQGIYPDILTNLIKHDLRNITFETNGTQLLRSEFKEFLEKSGLQITWSVSPKLSVSGEKRDEAINVDVIEQLFYTDNSDLYLKFVVDKEEDFKEIDSVVKEYRTEVHDYIPVYIMPVGGCVEEYHANAPKVAKLCMEQGYRYTPREQLTLFGNEWGT